MSSEHVTRRSFVKKTAATATGLSATASLNKAEAAKSVDAVKDVTKTRSYNEKMEYRRLGKTNMMISVVSIGGHWKKIPHAYSTP